ncbi:YchJ family protein [Shewanella sp. Scap07]|uniref:YchJ family protein n=1 Tax=Shewanella sp. Scap07 TaxID=2589987 RepID=UPI002117D1C1|nr:YchJ family metal-binding protein [Shewanella sp. Scap07]
MNQKPLLCPCGQQQQGQRTPYTHCCEPYHLGHSLANNPETLMRSRYSAFVLQQHQYLIDTHHGDYLGGLTKQVLDGQEPTQWIGLQVISSANQQTKGSVTFQAWYLAEHGLDAIHEQSDFVFEQQRWWYTSGKQFKAVPPKRNMACVCHSGKKFKQCCMNKG